MARKPAVAGAFYPKSAQRLRSDIGSMLDGAHGGVGAVDGVLSFVAPHAGYMYSGAVAAYAYRALETAWAAKIFETVVVIGPNHTGEGDPLAVSMEDWETPLGIVKNDTELAGEIVDGGNGAITVDEAAHTGEHSVEVQLPFLQMVAGKARCAFICMGDQSPAAAEALADAILWAEERMGRRVTVLASSDFNHYEDARTAKAKDTPLIDALCRLDVAGFYNALARTDDSACGFGPMAAAAMFARSKGAKAGRLLKYTNSGETTGDYSSVVAYASLLFGRQE